MDRLTNPYASKVKTAWLCLWQIEIMLPLANQARMERCPGAATEHLFGVRVLPYAFHAHQPFFSDLVSAAAKIDQVSAVCTVTRARLDELKLDCTKGEGELLGRYYSLAGV